MVFFVTLVLYNTQFNQIAFFKKLFSFIGFGAITYLGWGCAININKGSRNRFRLEYNKVAIPMICENSSDIKKKNVNLVTSLYVYSALFRQN